MGIMPERIFFFAFQPLAPMGFRFELYQDTVIAFSRTSRRAGVIKFLINQDYQGSWNLKRYLRGRRL